MIFGEPIPFAEALQSRAVKSVLPTSLTSRELRALGQEILDRATFSARVTSAEYLDTLDRLIGELVDGKTDQATVRMKLKAKIAQLGGPEAIGQQGTGLRDLGSDLRLNLQIETNVEMAQGYGAWKQGQDAAILDQWPAQELIRVIVPQGPPRDWPSRWESVGGEFYDGRMIALKNAPIWQRLGDEFEDGLGNPYPPFAFSSGMDVQDIDREEAMRLGLIDRDTRIRPRNSGFNEDLKFSPDIRSKGLRNAIEESDDRLYFDADGVLRVGGKEAA
jgi:hypothetical protein